MAKILMQSRRSWLSGTRKEETLSQEQKPKIRFAIFITEQAIRFRTISNCHQQQMVTVLLALMNHSGLNHLDLPGGPRVKIHNQTNFGNFPMAQFSVVVFDQEKKFVSFPQVSKGRELLILIVCNCVYCIS